MFWLLVLDVICGAWSRTEGCFVVLELTDPMSELNLADIDRVVLGALISTVELTNPMSESEFALLDRDVLDAFKFIDGDDFLLDLWFADL